MEVRSKTFITLGILVFIAMLAFALGTFVSMRSAEAAPARHRGGRNPSEVKKKVRVVYPKETKLDFEGLGIEGELYSPGEFYFQTKTEDQFDSLVKRRKNFHREMMRDVVQIR